MGTDVWARHGIAVQCIGQESWSDVTMEVEGRAGDLVENADSPGRRKAANPIDDCALDPRR